MAHGKKTWVTTRKESKNSKSKFDNMASEEAGEVEIDLDAVKPKKKNKKKVVEQTVAVKARDLDEKVKEDIPESWDDEV